MIPRLITAVVLGGGLGIGWFKLVGCSTGACPLTRHPLVSMAYGALLGLLLAISFH